MKLIKCYIENFGKLHQYEYKFTDGLNIIKEDNGFGKTTLATFIKSMFYGLDTSVKAEKSDRKVYKPWQGGTFGGNIEFEIDGKNYRIERVFGNKSSEDTFTLYNLDTDLKSNDFSENIGEEIFKINKEAYERSTYIPQNQIPVQMEDSISAKLGNVLESENDINTSDEAIKKLKETMKFYIKTGGKGELNKKREDLSKLERDLENTKFDEENLEAREQRLNEINKDIKEKQALIEQKQRKLTQKIEQDRANAKQETYNNILENLNKNQKEYNNLKEFFKNGVPEDSELEDISAKHTEMEKIELEIKNNCLSDTEKAQLNMLDNKFRGKEISEKDINEKIVYCTQIQEIDNQIQKAKLTQDSLKAEIQNNEYNRKTSKQIEFTLLAIGIIIAIIGIFLIISKIQKIAGTIAIILGVVFVVTSIVKNNKNSKNGEYDKSKAVLEELENTLEELEQNRNSINSEVDDFIKTYLDDVEENRLIALTNLKTEYIQYKELLSKKENKEEANQVAVLRKNQLENEIKVFINQYFSEPDKPFLQLMQDIKLNKAKLLSAEQEVESATKTKREYEEANKIVEVEKKSEETLSQGVEENEEKGYQEIEEEPSKNIEEQESEEKLSQDIKDLSARVNELLDMKNQLKNQIEVLENKIDENEYLQTDIDNLKEEIRENEDRYKILEKTKDLLETAKEDFSATYLKDMVNGFNKYLKLLDDTELETNVDINLNVKIDVNGSKKEVKNFSSGYQDLIYICIRFSLINALFKEESPFVVLDDPFVNLDDDKTKKAVSLLNKLSEDYQIIYFVCNTSRT